MISWKQVALWGLLVWVVPFVVAMFAFPLRATERPLFESMMAVALAVATVLSAGLYFRNAGIGSLKEGVLLGLVWMGMSIAIDLPLFMQGPMRMSPADYAKDIAVTYLMIPVITAGAGFLLGTRGR